MSEAKILIRWRDVDGDLSELVVGKDLVIATLRTFHVPLIPDGLPSYRHVLCLIDARGGGAGAISRHLFVSELREEGKRFGMWVVNGVEFEYNVPKTPKGYWWLPRVGEFGWPKWFLVGATSSRVACVVRLCYFPDGNRYRFESPDGAVLGDPRFDAESAKDDAVKWLADERPELWWA